MPQSQPEGNLKFLGTKSTLLLRMLPSWVCSAGRGRGAAPECRYDVQLFGCA